MNTNYVLSTTPNMPAAIDSNLIDEAMSHGFSFSVTPSLGCVSPRKNLAAGITSTLVTGSKGRSANLGDQRMITSHTYSCVADAIDAYAAANNLPREDMMCYTVYKREMGDIQLSIEPFGLEVGGSIAGFIFESRAKLREEFNVQRISPRLARTIEDRLQQEMTELAAWANGQVFDISLIDDEGDIIESLEGVYGLGHNINNAAAELLVMCSDLA